MPYPRAAIVGVLFVLLTLAACGGKNTPSPTPVPTATSAAAGQNELPTPYPAQTPPAGLPPAESFLPSGAWLALHVEVADGTRWTVVAYGDRDEVVDERNNRKWVDQGAFLSRERALWEGIFHQVGADAFASPTYFTACQACARMAVAVRLNGADAKGLWVQSRPYDARGPVILLLPVLQTLRLRVESFMSLYPEGEVTTAPPLPAPPAEPGQEDILRAVYGEQVQKGEDGLTLGEGITPWVAQVVPGAFTAHDAVELAALVGASGAESLTENATAEQEKLLQPRLVILQKQRSGSWKVIARSEPLGMNVPRDQFSLVIQRLSDFDRDGQQEILLTSASVLPRYLDGTHILYRWDQKEGNLRLVWTTTSYYDNTSLPQQPDYATQVTWPRWKDLDGDGVDEIALYTTRRTYGRQAPGFADTSQIIATTGDEVHFRWNGKGFLLQP